jgi:hypothetical protein
VFPTGSPRGRFWRLATGAAILTVPVTFIAALPLLGASAATLLAEGPSNTTLPGAAAIRSLADGPVLIFPPLGFVALAMRFFRTRGVERQQMKWFVLGAGVLVGSVVVTIAGAAILDLEDPISHPIGFVSFAIGTTAIPVSAGIAILRYRLYDIDRVISRTLSYAIVTGLLAAVFAGLVVIPAHLLGRRATPDYVIAGATLAVAVLVRPLRRRVQDVIDHRFNRRRYEAEHTIESFKGRLREQIDIDALGAELREIVDGTMQPERVWLWVKT